MATENINTSISVNSIDFEHSRTRHIVPFRFNKAQYGVIADRLKKINSSPYNVYDYFSDQKNKNYKWIIQTVERNRAVGKDKNKHCKLEISVLSDMLPNIKDECLFNEKDEKADENCLGGIWRYTNTEKGESKTDIISFLFCYPSQSAKESNPKYYLSHIDISEIGLNLYKNGIGFFWYEYQFTTVETSKLLVDDNMVEPVYIDNTNDFVSFQNVFKELGMYGKMCLYIKSGDTYKPLLLGSWIKNMLIEALGEDFLCFQFKRNMSNPVYKTQETIDKKDEKEKDSIIEKDQKSIANPMLMAKSISLRFNEAEYKICTRIPDGQAAQLDGIPDAAILFSYIVFEERNMPELIDEDTLNLIYRVTNGFNNNYQGFDIVNSIHRQNKNIVYSGNRQGCTYFSWKNGYEKNDYFLSNIMYSKIMVDFFKLYIRILYQSYSLQYQAEMISKDLPSDYRNYNSLESASDENLLKIGNIMAEINTFLAKVTTTSVSFQESQNNFYNYLIDKVRIKGDAKTVQAGLDILIKMQSAALNKKREEQEEKQSELLHTIEKLGTILTALGIPTLFMEISDILSRLINYDMISAVVSDFILLLSIFIQSCFINIVCKNLKRLRQEQKSCTDVSCKNLQKDSTIYSAVLLMIATVTLIMIIRLVVNIFPALSLFISRNLEKIA